ncbi:energy transducer TonB [Microvirga sp. STR05]|uniref:Energy transducer TonB n=1 Tax=Hymenobacter duratus TaxID=2771356 RepID=A0ABR8JCI7_9BACT|nr:energy transducer TonB [Hymenobacter duratus]MBD2714502.1 energy transducer TonB [Hymenobacter duratus]MBR7949406.1 energy transducer TonB [Microvirga sp. STR05]
MRSTLRRLALVATLALPAATHAQQKLKYPKPQPDQIYDAVAQPAVPVGGVEAYAQYLADHQQYPTAALQRGAAGTVTVTFVVEKSGVISGAVVAAPLDPDLDAEALRLIKAGPKWTPAQHKGAKVRQRVTVPISFQIPVGADEPTLATTSPAAPGKPAAPAGTTVVKADQPARPVGGEEAFFDWIQKNQKYPALARQRKLEGRVMVEFIVQKDGSLTDINVLKPLLGSGLEQEALRLIKAAPKWTPATYQGQPVKQKMVLPVLFQL